MVWVKKFSIHRQSSEENERSGEFQYNCKLYNEGKNDRITEVECIFLFIAISSLSYVFVDCYALERSWPVFINHSQEHSSSFSPRLCKFE